MGQLSLALLGTPLVRHGGPELAFPTRKALALLAYLAVEGGLQAREKLAALFWPESDSDRARASLRYTLAALRSVLSHPGGLSHVIAERHAVRFDSSSRYELDLRKVEAASSFARAREREPQSSAKPSGSAQATPVEMLEKAAALCRGAFLEGFSLPDAPEFDDWESVQREIWHRRMESVSTGCRNCARRPAISGARSIQRPGGWRSAP